MNNVAINQTKGQNFNYDIETIGYYNYFSPYAIALCNYI